eukprot:10881216-Heterocapsa_arctica.AAC.1
MELDAIIKAYGVTSASELDQETVGCLASIAQSRGRLRKGKGKGKGKKGKPKGAPSSTGPPSL